VAGERSLEEGRFKLSNDKAQSSNYQNKG
jgi:hypothetical protein